MVERTERPIWKSSLWVEGPQFNAYRHGRFVITELNGPHRVLSTSSCVGGVSESIQHLVNHQSCEASGHGDRFNKILEAGLDGYHRLVCGEVGLAPETTAVMGTAANMIYAAHHVAAHGDVRVDAIVTAGVEGNAATAGDPARWVETPSGWDKLPDVAGTINTIVLINQPLKPEAQIRSVITITEGKTAALMELGVSSRYSRDLATGTGTDQICLAAPIDPARYAYSAANPHSKLGELLGRAVRSATKSALRWQNGLEPSLTRSLTHALRRFDFSEVIFLEAMRPRLTEAAMRLLEGNRNAVLYEPQVAAAAYAFAGVWDRARAGVIPESAMRDVLRLQAATLAAALAADTQRWHAFWLKIDVQLDRPLDAIFDAVALGWTAKWDSTH
jgi:adenosylcobinamide amidohydrolase